LATPIVNFSHGGENDSLHNQKTKSQGRWLMMDLVFVLTIIGFFVVCIAYTYAFDRI
jgi:hypothetical protein